MLKNIIGEWGASLAEGDYACALAALGVLESRGTRQHRPSSDPAVLVKALEDEFARGERTPVWRFSHRIDPSTTLNSWRETVHTDVAALAAAWRQLLTTIQHPRQLPRLGVELQGRQCTQLFDFDALCAWLKHPDVVLDALVLADARAGRGRIAWHWPLMVGIPVSTENTGILAALNAARTQHPWSESLSKCFTVGAARDACDLLLLPPASEQDILGSPRVRIRASFVVCFDNPPSDLSQVDDRYRTLLDRLRAAGVAVAGRIDDPMELGNWFIEVLRELSHDLPIHGAVWSVGHSHNRDPLLLGDPEGLDGCRILAIADRQDRIALALDSFRRVHAFLSHPRPELPPQGAAAASAQSPRPRLTDELRGLQYTAERVDGLRTAQELANHLIELEPKRVPRWIQASAWRPDSPETDARSLAAAQWNLVAVHIGPTEVRRLDVSFPSDAVDFGAGDVVVTVQLELARVTMTPIEAAELGPMRNPAGGPLYPTDMRDIRTDPDGQQLLRGLLARRPLQTASKEGSSVPGIAPSTVLGLASSTITLPPAGNSTLALFAVCPQERAKTVDGRIAIIYNNRVLQTARVSIQVRVAADGGSGLTVVSEATIHARDDDLNDRREYDVAMQVSDVGGKLHLAIQNNGTATSVQLDNLKQPITAIGEALERAAVEWDFSKPMLEQPVFSESLYTLAAHGSSLEQHLRKTCGDDIDRWERIHLVPSTQEFLPLEYVYDGPPPKVGATVCRNVLGALEGGSCERALSTPAGPQPCPNQRDKSFVCPMHFWGFRRLIERNGTVHAAAPLSPGAAQLPPVSVPSKQAYGTVRTMLFAASNRAFLYATAPQTPTSERAALVSALGALFGTPLDASDWDDWRQKVQNNPNLLVLVVHTDQYLGTPVLEIGQRKLLGRNEILPDLCANAGEPQLLVLLGCSAANVTEDFQPYPERFRDAGASIVIAPVAPIRGGDAVPIAKGIAQLLANRFAGPEPTAFGELLPILRRQLLRQGHPGVMGIVGFGDGDWLIGGRLNGGP